MKFLQTLFLIFGLIVLVNAQKAVLSGTLYDATGAVIPKEKVAAINERGEKFEALTDDDGVYSLSLPFNSYDARTSSANFKIAKFEIVVDLEHRGFEKFSVRDFKFVPAYSGKMIFDIALDSRNPEPCGYAGAHCLESPIVENTKEKVENKILQRPLKKLPKEQNENKRTASLSGKVYDQAGAIIPDAKISLTNKVGKKFETFTNDDGFYEITIPSGTYLLEAEYSKHQAWEKFKVEKYEVASVAKMILDITLAVDEEFTKKYGTSITADPIKQNKTKRKNKN